MKRSWKLRQEGICEKKTTKLASPLQNEQPIKSGSNVQKENKNKNNIDYKKKNTFYHDDFNNR